MTEYPITPQNEPLWVGMMHSGWALSGRVVGWTFDSDSAPFPKSDLSKPTGPRGRAVVLIHATDGPHEWDQEPLVTIDANWPARYVATAEDAWREALRIKDESDRRFAESERRQRESESTHD